MEFNKALYFSALAIFSSLVFNAHADYTISGSGYEDQPGVITTIPVTTTNLVSVEYFSTFGDSHLFVSVRDQQGKTIQVGRGGQNLCLRKEQPITAVTGDSCPGGITANLPPIAASALHQRGTGWDHTQSIASILMHVSLINDNVDADLSCGPNSTMEDFVCGKNIISLGPSSFGIGGYGTLNGERYGLDWYKPYNDGSTSRTANVLIKPGNGAPPTAGKYTGFITVEATDAFNAVVGSEKISFDITLKESPFSCSLLKTSIPVDFGNITIESSTTDLLASANATIPIECKGTPLSGGRNVYIRYGAGSYGMGSDATILNTSSPNAYIIGSDTITNPRCNLDKSSRLNFDGITSKMTNISPYDNPGTRTANINNHFSLCRDSGKSVPNGNITANATMELLVQ